MKKCFLKMITTILACALIFLSSSNILAATPTRAESDYLSNHALFIDGYQVVSSGNLQGMLSVADPNYSYFRSIYFTNDQVYPYSLGTRSGYIDEFILVS